MTLNALIAALLLGIAGHTLAAPSAAAPDAPAAALRGEVLEVRDADVYTYLRLKTAHGETWAAVTRANVKVGAQVAISDPTVMQDFESKVLKRRFDRIVFGNLADTPAAAQGSRTPGASPHAGQGMGMGMGGAPMSAHVPHAGGSAPAPTAAAGKVARASGANARTVAEIVTGKAMLKDKPVSLQARVVKVSTGIMGKNWLHVQDGSGSASAGTNDLLVTTTGLAAVGDVITLQGTVRTNVQLGAGYEYAVLVEDATLRK
jgi:hypothetical protein